VLSRADLGAPPKAVLFGRSLGGAVAIHLAARNAGKVAGLIVENTFLSVEDMAAQVLPPLGLVVGGGKPLNCLVTNKWRNVDVLPSVTDVPLLLLASRRDEMVPFAHMERLRAAARAPSVEWLELPDSQHMDGYITNQEVYWPALRAFLTERVEKQQQQQRGGGAGGGGGGGGEDSDGAR
jgi:pimeloyl-ACP methyl ester carboxylesterase